MLALINSNFVSILAVLSQTKRPVAFMSLPLPSDRLSLSSVCWPFEEERSNKDQIAHVHESDSRSCTMYEGKDSHSQSTSKELIIPWLFIPCSESPYWSVLLSSSHQNQTWVSTWGTICNFHVFWKGQQMVSNAKRPFSGKCLDEWVLNQERGNERIARKVLRTSHLVHSRQNSCSDSNVLELSS